MNKAWYKIKLQTLTPPGKQKAAKSLERIASLFPGGYLNSICKSKRISQHFLWSHMEYGTIRRIGWPCTHKKKKNKETKTKFYAVNHSTWGSKVPNEGPRWWSILKSIISDLDISISHFFLLANASSTVSRLESGWSPATKKCSNNEVGSLYFLWSYKWNPLM